MGRLLIAQPLFWFPVVILSVWLSVPFDRLNVARRLSKGNKQKERKYQKIINAVCIAVAIVIVLAILWFLPDSVREAIINFGINGHMR